MSRPVTCGELAARLAELPPELPVYVRPLDGLDASPVLGAGTNAALGFPEMQPCVVLDPIAGRRLMSPPNEPASD